jgi:squalene-hopene/tetraprenyl-beta-curcumene cyclase
VMAQALAGLEHFLIEDEDTILLQPAMSPVWDTAYVTLALSEAGLEPEHPALVQAAQWLLDRQVLVAGDWQVKRPNTSPGAWSFEFHNRFYPDVDDSTLVSMALHRVNIPATQRKLQAVDRAIDWILDMQGRSGGWAAFDVDNDLEMLAHIPFADFMTPLDPVSVDLTAHVVELLAELPPSRHNGALPRALGYIYRAQQEDGAWCGRWGVNTIYGTAAALMGLAAAGEDTHHPRIRRAVSWLADHQNTDGGWGESCHSYEDVRFQGVGDSTASQTAWAILGLLSAAEIGRMTVEKGVAYLLRMQSNDGRWHEEAFTGTGFPRAFYLRYHMYPQYFPLLALARYQKALKTRRE